MIPISDDNLHNTKPYIVYALIIAIFSVFMLEFWYDSLGQIDNFIANYGLVPANLTAEPSLKWLTSLSYQFIHSGWFHIIPNLLFLWIFGNNVEDALGHVRFLAFFLITGVISGLMHAFLHDFASTMPLIGASGAISATLGAYMSLFPRSRIIVFFPTILLAPPLVLFGAPLIAFIPFPAIFFLGLWFSADLYQALFTGDDTVAFWTHISGFLIGLALARLLKRSDQRAKVTKHRPKKVTARDTPDEDFKALLKRKFQR